jgi:hypothetical protein
MDLSLKSEHHAHKCFGSLRSQFERMTTTTLMLYLISVVVLVFLATPLGSIGGDSPGIAYLPISILRWGTLRLDPFVNKDPLFDLSRQPHWVVELDGHYYSKFSPVPSLLALPVYAPYVWIDGAPNGQIYLILSWFAAILIATAVTGILFSTLLRLVGQWQAFLLALLYAFGTYTWVAASGTLASQSSAELFLILAIWSLVRCEQANNPQRRWYALAGVCVGLAVAARLNILLVALVLSAYVCQRACRNWPALLAYGLGGLVVALLLGAYNTYAFGSPLRTGYGSEADAWSTPLWVGLPGMLISPGHGLLMYSPALLLAGVGGWAVWRAQLSSDTVGKHSSVLLGRYLALACLVHLLLMSHWWAWHGGNAYNQRMLQEVHPLLLLLLGFALQRFHASRLFVALLVGGGLWAVLLHIAGTAFYEPWTDNFRSDLVWSLRGAELATYLRIHGAVGFAAGMARVMLRIGVAIALPSLPLGLLALRTGRPELAEDRSSCHPRNTVE